MIKVNLPNIEDLNISYDDMTPDVRREKLKERGILPPNKWQEVPLNLSHSGQIFDPYVPEEGDGKVSFLESLKKVSL